MSERPPDITTGEGEELGRRAARQARRGKLDEAARRDIVARYTSGEKVAAIVHRYQVDPGAIYHLNHRIILRRNQSPTHGTPAGYQWHRRHAQSPCPPCAATRAEAQRPTANDDLTTRRPDLTATRGGHRPHSGASVRWTRPGPGWPQAITARDS